MADVSDVQTADIKEIYDLLSALNCESISMIHSLEAQHLKQPS
jgi:hypothetical protein